MQIERTPPTTLRPVERKSYESKEKSVQINAKEDHFESDRRMSEVLLITPQLHIPEPDSSDNPLERPKPWEDKWFAKRLPRYYY
jgi:hypothetical protein